MNHWIKKYVYVSKIVSFPWILLSQVLQVTGHIICNGFIMQNVDIIFTR